MQSTWQVLRKRDFSGGENQSVLPELLAPNQLLQAINCIKTPDGLIETRKGKTLITSQSLGAGPIISIHRYTKENGAKYILVQHGTTLYAKAWDGVSALDLTTGAITKTVNAAKLRSRVWRDNIILTNGSDNVFRFDGTAYTDLAGSPPKSKLIAVYGSKLWLVDAAYPNQLRFSGLENYDSWDALDVIKIRTGDSDIITGLSAQPGGMVVFKNKSTWVLYGTSRDNIRVSTSPIAQTGCVSFDSIIDAGFVFGGDNIYQFDLTSVTPIGDTHRPTFNILSTSEKENAIAVPLYREGRGLLQFNDSTILNIEARYGGILTWSGLNAKCFCALDNAGDDDSLLIGDATNGVIYKLNNLINDAGTAINTKIVLPYLDCESIRKKVFRSFIPEMEPVSGNSNNLESYIYLTYDVDYSKMSAMTTIDNSVFPNTMDWGIDIWGEAFWGEKVIINEPMQMHGVSGNRIAVGIQAHDRVRFYGCTIKYREVGRIN